MVTRGAFTVLLLLVSGASAAAIGDLDFPPLDLKATDSDLTLSFFHPRLFYAALKESDGDDFNFTASSDAVNVTAVCRRDDFTCHSVLRIPGGGEKCVALSGSLLGGTGVREVKFRETGRVCLSAPPPTNVTLTCRNLKVTLSWESEEPRPQTRFRVHLLLGGLEKNTHHVDVTSDLQYDLSRLVTASEEKFTAFHGVNVTALEGRSQSESLGKTFTFNERKTAYVSCKLDFPPVELTRAPEGAMLSFINPLHFYQDLEHAVDLETSRVSFTATTNNGSFHGDCRYGDRLCRLDLDSPDLLESCVLKLTGFLDTAWGGRVAFRDTGPVCISEASDLDTLTLPVILFVVFALVIIVVVVLIWKVKAWTMKVSVPTPTIPETYGNGVPKYARVAKEDVCNVSLIPLQLHQEEEEQEEVVEEEQQEQQQEQEEQQPGQFYMEGGLSEGYGRDNDSAESSQQTLSSDLEEEEQEEQEEEVQEEVQEEEVMVRSPYDCPHTLQV